MIRTFLKCILIFSFSATAFSESSQPLHARPSSWAAIKHIVLIVLENTNASDAMAQPFMQSLMTRGAYLSNFYATQHPSQPNYFAMVGGSTYGVNDNNVTTIDALHIGDLFDIKGLTWKAYGEDYPGNCYLGADNNNYARKHMPFISYRTVQSNPTQCAKVTPSANFYTDAAATNLPTFSLYIPNDLNNGHDTGVAYADNWLKTNIGPVMNSPAIMQDTLFIITFDEDDSRDNKVYTVFVGAGVRAGAVSTVRYNHYSLTKTIESIFELASLCTNDASATEISDIWLP